MVPSYSPDQIRILQTIVDDTATQASAVTGVDIDIIQNILNKIDILLADRSLEPYTYALVLAISDRGTRKLDRRIISTRIHADTPIIYIDKNLHFVRAVEGSVTPTGCSRRSHQERSLEIRVEAGYAYHYLAGLTINQVFLKEPGSNPVSSTLWRRPMSEFDALLDDHMEERVNNEQGPDYWYDRQNRILKSGNNGTEYIFHKDLFWWVKHFAADAIRIYGETKGMGQAKHDINIVTPYGTYVIEVKWLGINESGTTCDESKINQGLEQVKLYLFDRSSDLIGGYLVAYDGRPQAEHLNNSTWDPKYKHDKCEPPKIKFLVSETPSETAPKNVGKSKTSKSKTSKTSKSKTSKTSKSKTSKTSKSKTSKTSKSKTSKPTRATKVK